MPPSSTGVLSKNGFRACGAELRRLGVAAGALAGAGGWRRVRAMLVRGWCLVDGGHQLLILTITVSIFGVQQIFQLAHELADVAEVTIDGGESDVGNLV